MAGFSLIFNSTISVMRHLVNVEDLPEDHFRVAGYGPNKPIALPIDIEKNRKANRRVEIIAIPKRNEKRFPKPPADGFVGGQRKLVPSDADIESTDLW